MLVLTIESSCDETAAAVVKDGRRVLSNIVSSQIDIHSRFGGVVPELASRCHVESITLVIDQALEKAGLTINDIEGIGMTRGPGLIGALLVGLSAGKAIALAKKLPFVGLHHMEGHILAALLEHEIVFPFLALAVSGGHTHLYRVDGIGQYRTLARTRDDAAGEAFDKVAKLLGLGYPGGARIDELSAGGNPEAINFPRPMLHKGLDFSFSGIKTAVRNFVVSQPVKNEQQLQDLAASFQTAVIDVLVAKTFRAAKEHQLERIVVCGGVACNRGLRHRMQATAEQSSCLVYFPSPALCADNAAMLGVAADHYLENGAIGDLGMNAVANWPLDQAGQ
ncbi:MAG: tRNA (adenosine(37)-N6)-threonylcarbamoyltransferase complex transferase subunit TsaD [Desulfuromonas sp.]|nr:MAG: tRNA (adenosine(37)-N6)-threonylcarbamoyltransferase complex transferase subunit TsaD [Desulfuromonas sp.]